ncbi:MAG: V-type ATP synthase subunit F [Deltaproteobacteria bacterium]|nr:MAG: V-type ATP synthase subunit F [Deltaproteobacteria bacterium]
MKFYIIGDKDTVIGFSLVGIEGAVALSQAEALRSLRQALNRNDIGIILITERLGREIQPIIDELLSQKKCTLILQIPDLKGPLQGRRTVEEVVLSALGVKV